jgi:hypothetical protein
MAKKIKLNTRSCFIGKRYRDLVKPQREPPLNLTDQGYCADRLAANEPTGQNSKADFLHTGLFHVDRICTYSFWRRGITRRLFVFLGS